MTSVNGATVLSSVDSHVLNGLKTASDSTGIDFSYLVAQASMESSLKPNAKAQTSSATGLFQFVEQTWLSTFRQHGAKYGQADLASAIQVDSRGKCCVSDAATRQRILDMRKDPTIASALGAELARDNGDAIQGVLGREAGPTELYLAHFLGAGGATQFLSAMGRNGNQPAASLFPEAAAANRSVFYDGSGRARSLSQIYDRFAGRMSQEIQRFVDLPSPVGMTDSSAWAGMSGAGGQSSGSYAANASGSMLDAMRSIAKVTTGVLSPTLVATLASLPIPGHDADSTSRLARESTGLDSLAKRTAA